MTRDQVTAFVTICLLATTAQAQEPTSTVTVVPADSPRWDAAAHVIWLGERRSTDAFQWDRWFGVASGGGSVGYYWSSHLKTELDLSTSGEGDTFSLAIVQVPGSNAPLYLERTHELRFTTVSAGLFGQFFENAWFHPFVGAGIELVRERQHIDVVPPPLPPRASTVGSLPTSETRVNYRGRPFMAAGFKVYVSDHAFIRSDIRTSWAGDGLAALGWRTGVGVDF